MTCKRTILYDGDMGGDDLWAIALLLANPQAFDLLGISTVFGNVNQPHATRNILNFLHWLKVDGVRVVQGSKTPYDGMHPFGDEAYGADGVGGVILPESRVTAEPVDIADWYHAQTNGNTTVTILCTGPTTNIAHFLQKYPQKTAKIQKIVLMCGAITPPGANFEPVLLPNGDIRRGNITEYAEFNAYQDPNALNILLKSGVRCVFVSADASQYMVLSPERQAQIKALHPVYGPAFYRMLMAVEPLDRAKFGVDGPFIHDPNVITYLLRPDLYQGRSLPALTFTEAAPDNPRRGQALETGGQGGNILWLNKITDPDAVFAVILEGFKTLLGAGA